MQTPDAHTATLQQLEGLRAAWQGLWMRDPAATPFQAPAWLIPWWRHLGGGELLPVEARHDGRLVGLAPLFVHRESSLRKLMPVGIGISDYFDILVDPAFAATAVPDIFTGLARRRDRWDLCEFPGLRPGSPFLASPLPGWQAKTAQEDVCPVLELPPRLEDLPCAVPRITLRNLKQARRRAGQLGPVRVQRADTTTFDAVFDALLRLHGACWAERGERGVLADAAVQRFHREAAADFLSIGVLRLYAVHIADRLVAVYYGFVHGGRAYAYLSGFDPNYERQSFGTLVVGHAIEEAVREGLTEFHFLRGGEAYKYAWGARDRVNAMCRLRLVDAPNLRTARARNAPRSAS